MNPNKKIVNVKGIESADVFIIYTLDDIGIRKSHITFQDLITSPTMFSVSYTKESERYMFLALAKCYNVATDKFTMEKSVKAKANKQIYCSLQSQNDIRKTKRFTIVDYEMNDKARLEFFIPFIRFKYIDIDQSTYACIMIDNLIYTYSSTWKEHVQDSDANNFYQLFFPFVNQKSKLNEKAVKHANVNVNTISDSTDSQNKSSPVSIEFTHQLPITTLVNKYDEYIVISISQNSTNSTNSTKANANAMIHVGDTILLSNQKDASHNGKFIVSSTTSESIILETMPSMNFHDEFTTMPSNKRDVMIGKSKYNNMNNALVWFTDLDVPGNINNNMAIVHSVKRDSSQYECVTNPNYNTQQTCESEYDGLGDTKLEHDVWDKRCSTNTDCPFYDANKGRGKCDNGYCEMPLGVKQVGYTRYGLNEDSYPYCHGCPDPLDPNCCNESNKDYAFAHDAIERLHTIVESFIPDKTQFSSMSPVHELNDVDFYNTYFSTIGNQYSSIPITELIKYTKSAKSANPFFLNDSCKQLLQQTPLDNLGYLYMFGKTDELFTDATENTIYFTAIVCIHAPSKEKGKVIKYDCKYDNTFYFANINVIGYIPEDQLI